MRNQYEGMVTLDQNGRAVVQLPDYFDALNADEGIHYQLTCVGGYAPVYIAQEVDGNQFSIAGGCARPQGLLADRPRCATIPTCGTTASRPKQTRPATRSGAIGTRRATASRPSKA